MPLPFGEAYWGGQEVRRKSQCTRWPPPGSGVFWCSMNISVPYISLLSDQPGSIQAAKIALFAPQKRFAWCWGYPFFRPIRVAMSSEHLVFRVGKGCFFVDLSVSLKDLQGLASHTQTLDEDIGPWSNFLPKGSLQGSGNPPHWQLRDQPLQLSHPIHHHPMCLLSSK